MNGSKLYERLRKEQYLWCQGKRPSVLKAACEYIEGLISEWHGGQKHPTQHEIAMKYDLTPSQLGVRYREIVELLNLQEIREWLLMNMNRL